MSTTSLLCKEDFKMTLRLLYFSSGSMLSISLIYLLREGFLIYPFIILCVIVIMLIFFEIREFHYNDYLKRKRGE